MKASITLSPGEPVTASAEFSVGIGSFPDLADHGFEDMVVVPGALYLAMARSVAQALAPGSASTCRHVEFHSPIILSAEDTVIRVDVRTRQDGGADYTFYEAGGAARAASLDVERTAATEAHRLTAFDIEAFQSQALSEADGKTVYGLLLENGNLYGPSFQRISRLWRRDNEALGKLAVVPADPGSSATDLHPSLLDAGIQLLAAITADRKRTFILRSIARVEVHAETFAGDLWAHATLTGETGDAAGLTGSVRIFDEHDKPVFVLDGVGFSLLDRLPTAADAHPTAVVVAANFTAEPVGDALSFRGEQFGRRLDITFAPYNQLFQQLLDPASSLGQNRDGINVILLDVKEWVTGQPHRTMTLSADQAARHFGSRPRYTLPNGLQIVQLNPYETDYVYKEIFEDRCYLKHGISLRDGDTVVDIGANIGLFSLFVMSQCRASRVFAFEPAPAVYELLRANCEAYGATVHAVNAGVSDAPRTATFTFYEKSSVFSGFHTDEADDREAIEAIVRNTLASATTVDPDAVQEYVRDLTADRLRRTTHEVRLTSVSEIIREHAIDTIDLLKIDAERSELDIIGGIADDDWPRIRQLVMEIHDRTEETVARIQALLVEKGFQCTVEHERLLEGSGLFNLYATRDAVSSQDTSHADRDDVSLDATVDDFTSALRSFTQHAPAPLILCMCPSGPRTPPIDEAESRLLSAVSSMPRVHAIRSSLLLTDYSIADYYDPHAQQAGHVPYTPEGFAAVATAVTRTIYNLERTPFKVIVLDCDNTLWKGVCGEDGPAGVEITASYRFLQQFMVDQVNAGMLLCLCSKNDERDVLDVFERRTDMVLKREHLVAHRINWSAKSDNIRSLAAELGLGLESVILVDDNPVECAEVRSGCPEVLTLELPADSSAIPAFLNHVWAFDRPASTDEDRNRTRMYRDDVERRTFQQQTLSLGDFITGLNLRVEIAEATAAEVARISQLTWRTNQFNFTTIRRSEQDVRDYLADANATCLTVRVKDRFGDYGLVGVVMYTTAESTLRVDTLLLSCRVLGRGVEHAILSDLGTRAMTAGVAHVDLTYRPTGKNDPARAFAASVRGEDVPRAEATWTFDAERLARLRYEPVATTPTAVAPGTAAAAPLSRPARVAAGTGAQILQRIAQECSDMTQVTRAIESARGVQAATASITEPTTDGPLDARLLNIWQRVLGVAHIGQNDNFFDVGGTSLKAVQVVALVRKELAHSLSIVTLFECPTVASLTARLREPAATADTARDTEAALRGQKRRTIKRQRAS